MTKKNDDEKPRKRGRPRAPRPHEQAAAPRELKPPRKEPLNPKDREVKRDKEEMREIAPLPFVEADPEVKARKDHAALQIKRMVFLANIRAGKSMGGSCEAAGLSRNTVKAWMANDPDFLAEYQDAEETGTDAIEDRLMDMAMGRSPNFLALIATLKARRAHKWRENIKVETETTHKVDGAVFEQMFSGFADKLRATVSKTIEARREALRQSGMLLEGEAQDITPLLPPGASG